MSRMFGDKPDNEGDRYYDYYRYAPFSIWEEDFSEVRKYFDHLKKKEMSDVRLYFERHPEEILSIASSVKVLWVNGATLKMYDAVSQVDLLKDLSIIFNKESYDVFTEELIALYEGKTEFSSEAATLTLKGKKRHILLKLFVPEGYETTLSRVLVYIVDISDIKMKEEELKKSEEKYRAIFQTAHDPIFLVDVETGIIVEANKQAEHLLDMSSSQIIGMHFTQLCPYVEEGYHKILLQSYKDKDQYYSDNLVVCRKGGESSLVVMHATVLKVQERKFISAVFKPIADGIKMPDDVAQILKYENALTSRENEIVKLIASGLTTKKIAERLYVSEKTIATHRARIMQKLGIHKSAEIVRYAFFSGLLEDI